jgi:hypothetical protein
MQKDAPTQQNKVAELAQGFDLLTLPEDFYDNPFPYYEALREHSPVKQLSDGSFFLTRYADIIGIYKNTSTFSSDKKIQFKPKFGDTPLYEHHTNSLVFNDPPLHTRVRSILNGALVPKAINAMEPGLTALVDELISNMKGKSQIDLLTDFASVIPIEIIGNLLDIPHSERAPLRAWSLAILGALEPVISDKAADRGNQSVQNFLAYLAKLTERRRKQPGNPEHDVLTRLIQGETDGVKLSEKELLHNCIFLLNAGHETTTNLIGSALVTLHDNPEQRRRLIEQPDLIKTTVEEVLRMESPNQLGNRMATKTAQIGDRLIPAGSNIHLCIGAANRDPDSFADAQRFDIGRSPNRHLAFASGAHNCIGNTLARLEASVAISGFIKHFPDYQLVNRPVRASRARFRGFLSIPCQLNAHR